MPSFILRHASISVPTLRIHIQPDLGSMVSCSGCQKRQSFDNTHTADTMGNTNSRSRSHSSSRRRHRSHRGAYQTQGRMGSCLEDPSYDGRYDRRQVIQSKTYPLQWLILRNDSRYRTGCDYHYRRQPMVQPMFAPQMVHPGYGYRKHRHYY